MRAVTCHQGNLVVADLDIPVPAKGQLLVEVQRCGICGSDLHARVHGDELGKVMVETGYDGFMRSDQSIVFGHELYGVVADHGPGSRKKLAVGTPVVSIRCCAMAVPSMRWACQRRLRVRTPNISSRRRI